MSRLLLPLISFMTWAGLLTAAPDYLTNGDFEGIGGWDYLGENDGSHGIFSDPVRGGRTWMLQLSGDGAPGTSGIRQRLFLPTEQAWVFSMDVHEMCAVTEPMADRLEVTVNGLPIFTHNLGLGKPATGWFRKEAVFPVHQREVEIRIELTGGEASREASTVRLDNIRLSPSDEPLPAPLWPGQPVTDVTQSESVLFAAALGNEQSSETGYATIEEFRDAFHRKAPALAVHFGGWEPTLTEPDAFERMVKPALTPLVELGIVPIIAPATRAEMAAPILAGDHDAWFRAWAEAVRDWGYPVVLRPWREMDMNWQEYGMEDPAVFIQVWRHVRAIFTEAGADNVLWFWSPDQLDENSSRWYPGDTEVDLVGCSLYPRHGPGALARFYEEAQERYAAKPFAIAESGADDGRQADWLRSFLVTAPEQYPRMAFYTHLNVDRSLEEGVDFRIQADPEGVATLMELVKSDALAMEAGRNIPPPLQVSFERHGEAVFARLTHPDPRRNYRSRYRVEFRTGELGGGELLGRARMITLDPGESRRLRQSLPPEGEIYLSVDPSADPAYSGQRMGRDRFQLIPVPRG